METIRQRGDQNSRFPFDRYKNEGTWSLEHIHAQNSDSLTTAREWRDWLILHKKSLSNLAHFIEKEDVQSQTIADTMANIDSLVSHIDNPSYQGALRNEFLAIAPKIIKLLSDGNDMSQMHSLANMALLTIGENAALSNATFDVKRSRILEMDRTGEYIPACTRNVFLKYYSSADTKLFFWSEEDRKGYIQAMNAVLYDWKDAEDNEIKLIKERIHYGN